MVENFFLTLQKLLREYALMKESETMIDLLGDKRFFLL